MRRRGRGGKRMFAVCSARPQGACGPRSRRRQGPLHRLRRSRRPIASGDRSSTPDGGGLCVKVLPRRGRWRGAPSRRDGGGPKRARRPHARARDEPPPPSFGWSPSPDGGGTGRTARENFFRGARFVAVIGVCGARRAICAPQERTVPDSADAAAAPPFDPRLRPAARRRR